jgi:hypothetical protein
VCRRLIASGVRPKGAVNGPTPGRPRGFHTVLFTAFGVGVRASAHGSRALRVTAALLIAYGLWNMMGGFFPLDLNNDASVPGHIVATNAQLLLMVTAMGYAAAAFHGWLRWYSIASLVTSVVLGAVAFMFAAQAPHPMLGIGERISIGAFLLGVAVLAGALWRTRVEAPAAGADGSRRPNVVVRAYDWIYERCAGQPRDRGMEPVSSSRPGPARRNPGRRSHIESKPSV